MTEATTRLQARTSSNPPPNATPSTAAMTGLRRSRRTSPYSPPSGVAGLRGSFMSVPALKTRLVPVSTATRNAGSSSNVSNAADNSSAIRWSMALRLSGRFIAINRTWSTGLGPDHRLGAHLVIVSGGALVNANRAGHSTGTPRPQIPGSLKALAMVSRVATANASRWLKLASSGHDSDARLREPMSPKRHG